MQSSPNDEGLPILTEIVLLGRAALPPSMARTAPQPEVPIPWDAAYDPEAAAHAAPGAPLREAEPIEHWPATPAGGARAYPGESSPLTDTAPRPAQPVAEATDAPFPHEVAENPTGKHRIAPDTAAFFESQATPPEPSAHLADATTVPPDEDAERPWETAAVAATPIEALTQPLETPDDSVDPDLRDGDYAAPAQSEPPSQDPWLPTGAGAPAATPPAIASVSGPDPDRMAAHILQGLLPWVADRLDGASKQLRAQLAADLGAEINARIRAALAESTPPAPDDSARRE